MFKGKGEIKFKTWSLENRPLVCSTCGRDILFKVQFEAQTAKHCDFLGTYIHHSDREKKFKGTIITQLLGLTNDQLKYANP